MSARLRRSLFVLGILTLALAGAGYAWTCTPSYSLYHLRRALLTHDYATFSYYVDVDSVLDHALEELSSQHGQEEENTKPRSTLEKFLRKKLLKGLLNETAQGLAKAGLELVIEQVVRDRSRPLPEIPAVAILAALWQGQTEEGVARFPVKVKKGRIIEIAARQNSAGVWRVVAIDNIPALLPELKRLRKRTAPADESEPDNESDASS